MSSGLMRFAVVESLARETARIGVTWQSIIKVWLVERLKTEAANK